MTERTTATFAAIELRVADESERIVSGVVIPWNEVSMLTPHSQGERFAPGSLTRTVAERGDRVKLFRDHDHKRAIGRAVKWDTDDPRGLWGEFRIANTAAGDEALAEVSEGMLDAFSIGFRAVRTRKAKDGSREVLEAALHEASLAPIGAYDGARVLALRTPTVNELIPPMPAVNLAPIPPLSHWTR